jgi:hypothetical protein
VVIAWKSDVGCVLVEEHEPASGELVELSNGTSPAEHEPEYHAPTHRRSSPFDERLGLDLVETASERSHGTTCKHADTSDTHCKMDQGVSMLRISGHKKRKAAMSLPLCI